MTMLGKIIAASSAIPVLLLATLSGQITKNAADERLDKAIGILRMTAAAETKLIRWFEIDQDNPNAVGLKADLCGNWPNVKRTVDDISELVIQLKKDKSLTADTDLSKKVAQLLSLKQQVISGKRQLDAMGLTCPAIQERAGSGTTESGAPTTASSPGEGRLISVAPDFRLAARRALIAMNEVHADLTRYARKQTMEEDQKALDFALREAEAQLSPKSADSYIAESHVLSLFRAYYSNVLLLAIAKQEEEGKKLGLQPVGAPLREANAMQMAACKDEIPEALDANLSAKAWTRWKEASKCLYK